MFYLLALSLRNLTLILIFILKLIIPHLIVCFPFYKRWEFKRAVYLLRRWLKASWEELNWTWCPSQLKKMISLNCLSMAIRFKKQFVLNMVFLCGYFVMTVIVLSRSLVFSVSCHLSYARLALLGLFSLFVHLFTYESAA